MKRSILNDEFLIVSDIGFVKQGVYRTPKNSINKKSVLKFKTRNGTKKYQQIKIIDIN